MASLVPLMTFNAASERWESCLAQFKCYLDANKLTGITDTRKQDLFLSLCGRAIFKMVKSLMPPPPAMQKAPWNILQERLKLYYAPKKLKITYRPAFYHQDKAEGESISAYIAALSGATLQCQFANLEDALMDWLICRFQDAQLQRRLLAEDDLILNKAINEALAVEAAE